MSVEGGRTRRRALFGPGEQADVDAPSDDEEGSDSGDEYQVRWGQGSGVRVTGGGVGG